MSKVAVILSGCGFMDGSEIHESICTLLALDKAGATYQCFAPDIAQHVTMNHLNKQEMNESRSVIVEAARIARGNIKNIKTANIDELDAAIFPGGFGAAGNLSDFARAGAKSSVQSDVLAFAKAMAEAHKPQGFICIAPVLISNIYGKGVELTIGNDKATARAIEEMGGKHVNCSTTEIAVDKKHKVVSTPAYMLAKRISEVEQGVSKLVNAVLEMVKQPATA